MRQETVSTRLLLNLFGCQSQNINLTSNPAAERLRVKHPFRGEPSCEGSFAPLVLKYLARGRFIDDVQLVETREFLGR
jgi:hypothetical protein